MQLWLQDLQYDSVALRAWWSLCWLCLSTELSVLREAKTEDLSIKMHYMTPGQVVSKRMIVFGELYPHTSKRQRWWSFYFQFDPRPSDKVWRKEAFAAGQSWKKKNYEETLPSWNNHHQVLIKNLSVWAELWGHSTETSCQCYELHVGAKMSFDINNNGPHMSEYV